MDFSPQTVRSAGFRIVKKGYDQSEVDDFKEKVAAAIETAQNQATAMEARARAAVAKLQEVSQQVSSGTREGGAAPTASDEDAENISRTLLLAQRTADATVAQANAEAESITVKARVDATTVIDNARAMADKLLDEARLEARRSAENERIKAENEVQALLARRDFLLSDVDHLEHHVEAQRERLRDAAVSLQELIERVPGGLGELRRPLLSASAEPVPASQGVDAPTMSEVSDFANASAEPPASAVDEPASLLDATPPEMAAAAPDGLDETSIMSLDLELDRQPATAPKWSASGDDPLIIGDELQ
ncbi:MAG: DivIVA domain-containing protein [Ilumatobacteraceae bacterium]